MSKEAAFDPKKAAEDRKREMEEITAKLEQGVKEVFQGENYKEYLKFCAKLPRYSVNNQLLIMMQKPDATVCQSYTGWKDAGRQVKKGEHGIRILAPAPYKIEREQDKLDQRGRPILDRDGEPVKEVVEIKVNAFKPVSTFDGSQTEGKPLPKVGVEELTGSVEGYAMLLDAILQAVPVPVTFENIESGAKGFYHLEENRIAVQEGMSEAQTVKTILHEASHQALHSREAMQQSGDKKSRGQKEVEAESVAFVVCQHYGIDTSDYSFGYVAGWAADKELKELKGSLDLIRRSAADLIVKIDDKVAEMTSTKDIDAFVAEHADELPFDSPVAGYIEITPPAELDTVASDRPIAITAEAGLAKDMKEAEKREKTKKEKAAKKTSLKDKLKAGKEKAAKIPRKTSAKEEQKAM